MPHPVQRNKRPPVARAALRGAQKYGPAVVCTLLLALGFFSLPSILAMDLHIADMAPQKPAFPVTVNPLTRTIEEDPTVEALLAEEDNKLAAAAGNAGTAFTWLAALISKSPLYQQVAGALGAETTFVTILPGYREEEVARAFGSTLGWTNAEQAAFLTQVHTTPPTLSEGEFVPGTYAITTDASAADVQAVLVERFSQERQSRYGTSTAELLPLDDALTIASMLERETRDPAEMRIISGIVWNRLWNGMNLQLDATLQYAKANTTKSGKWWPGVVPNDKYIKSAYNTYRNKGLPPGPISNPSTAAVLAALNPKKTDCMFYFHDAQGGFHCSETYEGHVKMLRQKYGQGK